MTTFYTHGTYPADGELLDTVPMNAEFEAIEAGFAAVETAKMDKAGGTFTGPITYRGGGAIASNTAYGSFSGYSNTTGGGNTFSGNYSGYSNTTGSNNTFSGNYSGYSNTTGGGNVFSGCESGRVNTTGGSNVFSGYNSGRSNTTGSNNTFSGHSSGFNNQKGSYNTISGYSSGRYSVTGSGNTFSGNSSGYICYSGSYNTFSGNESGYSSGVSAIAGAFIVGVEYTISEAGSTDFTLIGAANSSIGTVFVATGVGSGNGEATPNVKNNVYIGNKAGYAATYFSNSVAIGANSVATASNQIVLGDTDITQFIANGVVTTPPSTAASAGTKGQFAATASHLYLCVATNTWVRTALATW